MQARRLRHYHQCTPCEALDGAASIAAPHAVGAFAAFVLDADVAAVEEVLNRIVHLYVEYAELQALDRKPMTMRDWITKLDEFLKISGRKLLDHGGTISAGEAKAKAELEYARYRALLDAQPQRVDAEFERFAKELKNCRS